MRASVSCGKRRATTSTSLSSSAFVSTARSSSQKPRHTAILEDAAVGLAGRAVEDRVLLEIDLGKRRSAVRARLAEPVVDAVGVLVVGTREAQLEAAGELVSDCRGEPLDLLGVELGRERVGGEPRDIQDLVGPGAADAGDRALITQQRVEAARVAREDRREGLGVELVGLGAEVGELRLEGVRAQQPDAGALLLSRLREDELAASVKRSRNVGVFGPFSPGPGCGPARARSGGPSARARRRRSGRAAAWPAARAREPSPASAASGGSNVFSVACGPPACSIGPRLTSGSRRRHQASTSGSSGIASA